MTHTVKVSGLQRTKNLDKAGGSRVLEFKGSGIGELERQFDNIMSLSIINSSPQIVDFKDCLGYVSIIGRV